MPFLSITQLDPCPQTTDTVTSDTAGVFNSTSNITQNQTFKFTFSTAGTFPYHCNIHPYMKATITVTS